MREALRLLQSASRPLVIAGGGVLRSGASVELVALAERTGTPVMTAFRRLDAFPNDHPLYLGTLSFGMPDVSLEYARSADVVLAVGTRLGELTTRGYTIPSAGAALVHIDISPEETGHSFPARLAIAADARVALAMLNEEAGDFAWSDRSR
ncbi:MAG: acetolactate synthase, partial [Chloroflexota bacterium]